MAKALYSVHLNHICCRPVSCAIKKRLGPLFQTYENLVANIMDPEATKLTKLINLYFAKYVSNKKPEAESTNLKF